MVIGRKNYLFAGSHTAAKRQAMLYSFFGTCKANGICPEHWLKTILTEIPSLKINQLDDSFLPIKGLWKGKFIDL